MKQIICFIIILLTYGNSTAQLLSGKSSKVAHADSLRGYLFPQRSCYDVTYYDLDLKLNIADESVSGSNKIYMKAVNDFSQIQIDLSDRLSIKQITDSDGSILEYHRDGNAIQVYFKQPILKNHQTHIAVEYFGNPVTGKLLPWDGGFKWTKDENGNPWVVVACQGAGASLWWPCKDHQSDEPDSMMISITVPDTLINISNGRLRNVTDQPDRMKKFSWFVSYPINTYNVSINTGKFSHFSDYYINGSDTLTLDYYVKPYNLDKARQQFQQVKPMLQCFERFFGKYPFWNDGYKLVETPYLGMEHQSCIAYGNKYKTGYMGTDYSGIGLDFDYIIIHESAHEWWGNSITTNDIADMWIHEGFGSYAEVLYVECLYGKNKAYDYVNAQRKKVRNDKPVIGPFGVNQEGSGDMYAKGSLLIHTIRNYISNDSLFFAILLEIQHNYALKTVNSTDIEAFFSKKSGINLAPIFNQYLRCAFVPVLEYEMVESLPLKIRYRWNAQVEDFNLPVLVDDDKNVERLNVTTRWQETVLPEFTVDRFRIRDDLGYFKIKQIKN
jgi:aminopeptidase N